MGWEGGMVSVLGAKGNLEHTISQRPPGSNCGYDFQLKQQEGRG